MKKLQFYNYAANLLIVSYFLIIAFSISSFIPKLHCMEEICDNAIDDDNDGLIDLNDPDCECEVIEPISFIPNPSFEEMDCCPNDRSQLDCATDWIQASEPTTDFIHTCDWLGWDGYPPPFPFPDGEGIMGFRDGRVLQNNNAQRNWKEYAGACLLSPLEVDSTYRFEFDVGFVNALRSPPINITFFGTTDCVNIPFGVNNPELGCPTNETGWVKLGSTLVSGGTGNTWIKASMEVTPEDNIRAIAIGPDCPHVQSTIGLYYFFDNLLLADLRAFDLQITTQSHPCQDDFSLQIPESSDYLYQWFKDGIALVGETSAQLTSMYGEGDYQVRIDDGEACRVSIAYLYSITVITAPENKTICKDESYLFGDQLLSEPGTYLDTFKSINNCDSIVSLNLNVLGALADTVSAKIFEGESYEIGNSSFDQEGDYLLTLVSFNGCDSLVLLQLEYYHIYIPNVFSPNFDGTNDFFTVFSGRGLLQNIELNIYDRWGAQVYQGEEWDGKYKGKFVNPGVFLYVAKLRMDDGIERQFSGSVTVVR